MTSTDQADLEPSVKAVSSYSWATLAWLSAQALPLITWPTFISSLLTPNYQHADGERRSVTVMAI